MIKIAYDIYCNKIHLKYENKVFEFDDRTLRTFSE